MRTTTSRLRPGWLLVPAVAVVIAACGSAAVGSASDTPVATYGQTATTPPASVSDAPTASAPEPTPSEPSPTASQPPGASEGTSQGDVPDNAVFLKYRGGTPSFVIQYVEGWQVSPAADGVVIRDKDSSETVSLVGPQADVPGYLTSTDLPALRAMAGFKLVKQDTVKVGASHYLHLVYHLPAPPDPVTGKQVPSTIDRYYVPGPNALAIISLSTPDGVDNVDAFRQMIESFRWS